MLSVSNSTCYFKRPQRLGSIGIMTALVAVLAVFGTGCTAFQGFTDSFRYGDTWNETAIGLRARSMSAKSWHQQKNQFCNEQCLSDFCEGYRQGFEDIATGKGNGCTPNFPPRKYWSWQYQSAQGQQKVSAWFAGYPHGARAAEESGVGNWSQIQMSSGLQAQYVTAGMLPNQGHAVYPIPATSGGVGQPTAAPPALGGSPAPVNASPYGP